MSHAAPYFAIDAMTRKAALSVLDQHAAGDAVDPLRLEWARRTLARDAERSQILTEAHTACAASTAQGQRAMFAVLPPTAQADTRPLWQRSGFGAGLGGLDAKSATTLEVARRGRSRVFRDEDEPVPVWALALGFLAGSMVGRWVAVGICALALALVFGG